MKYNAILIDPPWAFKTWRSHLWVQRVKNLETVDYGRNPENHYSTMTDDSLKALDLTPVMSDNCAVFMWVTWPTLELALELGDAWGIEYKTCAFMWTKTTKKTTGMFIPSVSDDANWHMGMGYWTRANTEPCLLFTNGKPKRKARNIRQLIVSAVQRHSQKPSRIHVDIEHLVDGAYLELFARKRVEGWTTLGNEIDGLDIQEAINKQGEL